MPFRWTTWRPLTPSSTARAVDAPGVYEIRRAPRHIPIQYPERGSRKLYIGSSERSVRERLDRHVRGEGDRAVAQELAKDKDLEFRTHEARFPERLEERRLREFQDTHGACPKGNEVCPSPSQRGRR